MLFPPIFCTGMLRSGSTWSFNVCRLLARIQGRQWKRPVWSGFLGPSQTDEFFQTYQLPLPGPTIIKAHALGKSALSLLYSGNARSVYTFRDPRDCVASMITFADESFETAQDRIGSALQWLDVLAKAPNTLVIRYEDMMANRLAQVKRIDAFLGLNLQEDLLRQVDQLTGAESSRKICNSLTDRPDDRVLHEMNHRVDPDSWLHHNHIQNGRWGRWREELTPEQVAILDEKFAPWLHNLGYANQTSHSARN